MHTDYRSVSCFQKNILEEILSSDIRNKKAQHKVKKLISIQTKMVKIFNSLALKGCPSVSKLVIILYPQRSSKLKNLLSIPTAQQIFGAGFGCFFFFFCLQQDHFK